MINSLLAQDILSEMLKTGGDFAEIFIENSKKSSIVTINGKVENALAGTEFGIGLRLFYKGRVIYAYTNNLDRENILNYAKQVALAISGNEKVKILDFNKKDYKTSNIHKIKIPNNTVNKQYIVDILKSASNSAFNYNSQITETSISYLDCIQNVCIINSEGTWAEDERTRTRVSINVIASNETEKQSGYFGPGAMKGFEHIEEINMDNLAIEASKSAITMLNAKFCPSGKMPVVIDNGFGGVIFHEACGHGLEATGVAKNASVFTGKIGEKIANKKVTAIDDGTIPNSWGSLNVDDEGIPTKKNILIENGILKNYMVDKFNGLTLNMPPTGSSRRESYKYIPTSRMTNTYIDTGNDNRNDIIKNTEYGIYAKYMGGGSVNTATGEFNFAVNEAYIIKNGEIKEPVRGATLIGKGSEVLMDIDMVSNNLKLSEGMCGASSGSIPVNVGQPMIRVSKIIVGGRK